MTTDKDIISGLHGKYHVPRNWETTCEGQTCKCYATSEFECGGCAADWTPRRVYELMIEVNSLIKERKAVSDV